MKLLKKIAIRILILISISVVLNFVYKFTLYPSDKKLNGLLTDKLENGISNAAILYFSASPNKAYPITDTDKRFISKIIDDNLNGYKVIAVDTGAIHAGVYKKLINLIPKSNNLKYIIVNMNYRSFGMSWIMSSLENSIEKQSVFYADRPVLLSRFLQGLNYFDAIPQKERQKIMLDSWKETQLSLPPPKSNVTEWCAVEKWGDWTNPKRNLADNYIKQYAFIIDSNNVRVKDFDEIVTLCQKKNINLVFNILGENVENCNYLVDSDLTKIMQKNINYLVDRYTDKDVIIVNNFSKIADSCFYERDFPTEHYNFTGRKIIADNIVKEILKFENK